MSPSAFTFKVSVPNDPRMAAVVGELARHAADYAQLEAATAAAFADRAQALAAKALNGGGGPSCTAVIAAGNGTLTVTIAGESTAQPL